MESEEKEEKDQMWTENLKVKMIASDTRNSILVYLFIFLFFLFVDGVTCPVLLS